MKNYMLYRYFVWKINKKYVKHAPVILSGSRASKLWHNDYYVQYLKAMLRSIDTQRWARVVLGKRPIYQRARRVFQGVVLRVMIEMVWDGWVKRRTIVRYGLERQGRSIRRSVRRWLVGRSKETARRVGFTSVSVCTSWCLLVYQRLGHNVGRGRLFVRSNTRGRREGRKVQGCGERGREGWLADCLAALHAFLLSARPPPEGLLPETHSNCVRETGQSATRVCVERGDVRRYVRPRWHSVPVSTSVLSALLLLSLAHHA